MLYSVSPALTMCTFASAVLTAGVTTAALFTAVDVVELRFNAVCVPVDAFGAVLLLWDIASSCVDTDGVTGDLAELATGAMVVSVAAPFFTEALFTEILLTEVLFTAVLFTEVRLLVSVGNGSGLSMAATTSESGVAPASKLFCSSTGLAALLLDMSIGGATDVVTSATDSATGALLSSLLLSSLAWLSSLT